MITVQKLIDNLKTFDPTAMVAVKDNKDNCANIEAEINMGVVYVFLKLEDGMSLSGSCSAGRKA